ncbi:MAG: 50S ribosomal protein L24 [Micavibrio sp.]|jgi:large subunit ribosomal protein L24|nr:MAG: 50S ribosomal protein L24 [Micavibrio sp.]
MTAQKKQQKQRPKLKIKKGDKVIVTTGRDKGSTGEVLKVLREENRAIVQGVNLRKKHVRPSQSGGGGIQEKETPIHISNIAVVDPESGKATRVGYTVLKGGRKVRVAKKSGEVIDE